MKPITYELQNNQLVIAFHGRIDSAIAPEAEGLISQALDNCPSSEIVLDFDELEYISSAGLRLLLKIRKQCPSTRIINASSEVFDILEMTGFSELIHVEKAYRRVSLEDCELIARGANGAVYRFTKGKDKESILKVSLHEDSLSEINRELAITRRAFVLGVPTTFTFDVVRVGDNYGAIYELLNSQPLSAMISGDPASLDECVSIFVDLLKTLHSKEADPGEFPSQKKEVLGWVDFLKEYLPENIWEKLYRMVNAVPENNHLVHGDFHGRNIILQNGEPMLIDMDTLSQGDPIFEFASIFNAYKGFSILDEKIVMDFQGISRDTAHEFLKKVYISYFETEDAEKLQEYEDKSALVGYARLLRRTIRRGDPKDETVIKTKEFYRNEVCRLTEKLDCLTF